MKRIIVPKPKNKKEHHYCELCNVIDMKAHKAAMLGHIPCLELVQKQKPKLFKLHDANGATPIHLAARENQIRAFRWLISNTGKCDRGMYETIRLVRFQPINFCRVNIGQPDQFISDCYCPDRGLDFPMDTDGVILT